MVTEPPSASENEPLAAIAGGPAVAGRSDTNANCVAAGSFGEVTLRTVMIARLVLVTVQVMFTPSVTATSSGPRPMAEASPGVQAMLEA